MAYKGLYPYIPGLTDELKRSRVIEIAPDIWMLEGYISTNFFKKPPSSNCFILRDEDMVLLVDTGTYPFYRESMLKILRRYKRNGAKKLVLMLTQGHFDHVCNNDVILEAGYDDVQFLLPEAEVSTIDLSGHWNREFVELMEYYNPFQAMPMVWPTAPINLASRRSTELAQSLLKYTTARLFRGINTLADRAVILPDSSKVKRKFGDVKFSGWEVGRFFAIHDATHSPGHVSFYDPKFEVFLTGDATLEINPPFFNSSMDQCIKMAGKFRQFAEQGFVKLATDAHRSSIWAARLAEELKYEPLHRVQTLDMAHGKKECIEFYTFFEDYYIALKTETLKALSRLGEADVPQLVEEFKASPDKRARFKVAAKFPRLPSRLDVMVAVILKEAKAPRRKEGDRIIFSPPPKTDKVNS